MTKILITGGIDENKNYLDSTEVLDLVRGPSANCNISNLTKPLAKATGGFLPNFGPIICGGSSTEITVAENECYLLSNNCTYIFLWIHSELKPYVYNLLEIMKIIQKNTYIG